MSTPTSPLRRLAAMIAAATIGALPLVAAVPAGAVTPVTANWTQLGAPLSGPSARHDAAMVYDPATKTTILFGGFHGTYLSDTWSWNGTAWAKLAPATSPAGLRGASMVYDALTNNVVLFGGLSASGPVADTWIWNGVTWTKSPAAGPSARSGAGMAYDASTHQVVLFGGKSASAPLADTWVWSGTAWSSPTLTGATPSARYQAAMVYDSATKQVVLFGGVAAIALGDTWTWSATGWTKQTVASPPARYGAAAAYDGANTSVILFGGTNGASSLAGTWKWNGTFWVSQLTPTAPSARYDAASAYDSTASDVLLFGGYDGTSTFSDTWSFDVVASAPRSVRATSNADSQSVVTWSAPATSGGSAIVGYSVTAADSTTSANGGQTCQTTAATLTCTMTGLTNGDHYVFAVSALTAVGPGAAGSSNVAIPAVAPSAPAITTVTPGAGRVTVAWSSPSSTGGTPIASYRVTANGNRGFCHVPAKDLSCRITGLRNGVPYTFTMTATNAAGTSPRSAVSVVVKPRTLASAPTIISTRVAGRNIVIRWSAPTSNGGIRLSGYNVYVGPYAGGEGTRPMASVSFRARSFAIHGVAGRHYFIFLRAVNVAGVGPHSNQVTAMAR